MKARPINIFKEQDLSCYILCSSGCVNLRPMTTYVLDSFVVWYVQKLKYKVAILFCKYNYPSSTSHHVRIRLSSAF